MSDANVGKIIGIYEILYISDHRANDRHKLYHVKCVFCGWESDMRLGDIKRSAEKCTHLDVNGGYKEFNSYCWSNQRINDIFKGMKRRCYNSSHKDYKWYGDKGIKICDEWIKNPKAFELWALDNGYADNLTIDRIDENKDYCPENCRWIPLDANAKYKSTTSVINVDGETRTGREWSKTLGLSVNVINTYIRKHGLENTIEFMRRYKANPNLSVKRRQSLYDRYMNAI